MKRAILLLSILFSQPVLAQHTPITTSESASYFKEIKKATKRNISLWNKNLYGNILLVDPQTRQVFSNSPDSGGLLNSHDDIYIGKLPENINIANTSISWSGKNWAMLMLPLPDDKHDRINLLAHELFHNAQHQLGFQQFNTESNHLDVKDGRIYLRLELEALKMALLAKSAQQQRIHLSNAFLFRQHRNFLFPNSNILENQLELNEGIAEFTGLIMSGRSHKEMVQHLEKEINTFFFNPTYIRSFAYCTTPVYGYLSYQKNKNWNKHIHSKTNLNELFIKQFQINLTTNDEKTIVRNANDYNGQVILQEEAIREENLRRKLAEYDSKLVVQPHLEISLKKMNVSFDPRTIIPLKDKGTVYPTIRIVDVWGTLEVKKNGALMSPNWNKISITIPTGISADQAEGDGWVLKLNPGYVIKKNEKTDTYILIKIE